MAVKEILKETQENVDLKEIEESFFDSMSNFHGKKNLSWISCLFNYELKDRLTIKEGMVHCHINGIDEVEKFLHQKGIYGQYGKPKALFNTKMLPKRFNLFMIGPEYNDKNLKIIGSYSELNTRDFEEEVVLRNINSNMEELIKGKHRNVHGEIKLKGPPTHPLEGVIFYKTWKMPVNSSFQFGEDIKDIQTFVEVYDSFYNYQSKRDKTFEEIGKDIVKGILDKREKW